MTRGLSSIHYVASTTGRTHYLQLDYVVPRRACSHSENVNSSRSWYQLLYIDRVRMNDLVRRNSLLAIELFVQ